MTALASRSSESIAGRRRLPERSGRGARRRGRGGRRRALAAVREIGQGERRVMPHGRRSSTIQPWTRSSSRRRRSCTIQVSVAALRAASTSSARSRSVSACARPTRCCWRPGRSGALDGLAGAVRRGAASDARARPVGGARAGLLRQGGRPVVPPAQLLRAVVARHVGPRGGGAATGQGIHILDQALWILGKRPVQVIGKIGTFVHPVREPAPRPASRSRTRPSGS